VNIPINLQARYDLFCVKSAVKPQPTTSTITITTTAAAAAATTTRLLTTKEKWNQFLRSNSQCLKQQISKFYPQIQCTNANSHIYLNLRPVSVCHLAEFCGDLSKCCQHIAVFRLFKLVSILHVGFLKYKILTVDRAEGQPASPCQISWRLVKLLPRYGDFSLFFKMPIICCLGFVIHVFGPPTKSIWWPFERRWWWYLFVLKHLVITVIIINISIMNEVIINISIIMNKGS